MSLEVRVATSADMPEVYALRHVVFVLGQDVPADMERDELDADALHAAARQDGVVVGTGRLLAPGTAAATATVGRMAVAESARGRGVGARVLALLEEQARARGWDAVELHAQTHALAFYARVGYLPFGEPYDEAGIEHLSMRKDLAAGP